MGKLEQNVVSKAESREALDHVEEQATNPLMVDSQRGNQPKEPVTIVGISDSFDGKNGGDEASIVKRIKPAQVSRKKVVIL